jgi:rod shape determining protein RodA
MQLVAKVKAVDHIKKFDYILFLTMIAITVFGLVVLKSATYSMKYGASIYKTQVYMAIAGTLICLFLNFIDYRIFKAFALLFYFISIALLGALFFVGEGRDEVGAVSWLSIPGLIKFQPAEVAKITYVLLLALLLEKMRTAEKKIKYYFMFIVFSVIPVALIAKQPDLGTAFAFVVSFAVMLFTFGIKFRYILIGGGVLGAAFPIVWRFVLKPYQKNRFLSLLQPELQSADDLYQINKAKTAISSGQWFGQGLFNGIQTQNNGIPIKESDFIFSVVGEELGFIGAGILLISSVQLVYRSYYSHLLYRVDCRRLVRLFHCSGIRRDLHVPFPSERRNEHRIASHYGDSPPFCQRRRQRHDYEFYCHGNRIKHFRAQKRRNV